MKHDQTHIFRLPTVKQPVISNCMFCMHKCVYVWKVCSNTNRPIFISDYASPCEWTQSASQKHEGLSNIKTFAQDWAIIHIIMFVIIIYHQNFVVMSTALIKIYVFWRPVLFLCSARIKGHLPICSFDKVITYTDVKQNYHCYLQTDAEQLKHI